MTLPDTIGHYLPDSRWIRIEQQFNPILLCLLSPVVTHCELLLTNAIPVSTVCDWPPNTGDHCVRSTRKWLISASDPKKCANECNIEFQVSIEWNVWLFFWINTFEIKKREIMWNLISHNIPYSRLNAVMNKNNSISLPFAGIFTSLSVIIDLYISFSMRFFFHNIEYYSPSYKWFNGETLEIRRKGLFECTPRLDEREKVKFSSELFSVLAQELKIYIHIKQIKLNSSIVCLDIIYFFGREYLNEKANRISRKWKIRNSSEYLIVTLGTIVGAMAQTSVPFHH